LRGEVGGGAAVALHSDAEGAIEKIHQNAFRNLETMQEQCVVFVLFKYPTPSSNLHLKQH
jgi:hypothetical protein